MAKKFMLLYGKNSVKERLKANPESIRKIFLADNFENPDIKNLIQSKSIICERLPLKKVEDLKHTKNVQGIVARVDHFSYCPIDEVLRDKKFTPLFLDRINDPQNLGVIIRTLACLGGFSLVIPESEACAITEAVMHVASGGENYLQVARVQDLGKAISLAKKTGFEIIGAVPDPKAKRIDKISFSGSSAIVLGAEVAGISANIQKLLDKKAYIPMHGVKLSLNVNTACTIFAYEIAKNRK